MLILYMSRGDSGTLQIYGYDCPVNVQDILHRGTCQSTTLLHISC